MQLRKLMAIIRELGEDGDRMTTRTTLMRHYMVVGGGDLWQIMKMSFLNLMTWWNPLMIHITHTTQHALVTTHARPLQPSEQKRQVEKTTTFLFARPEVLPTPSACTLPSHTRRAQGTQRVHKTCWESQSLAPRASGTPCQCPIPKPSGNMCYAKPHAQWGM